MSTPEQEAENKPQMTNTNRFKFTATGNIKSAAAPEVAEPVKSAPAVDPLALHNTGSVKVQLPTSNPVKDATSTVVLKVVRKPAAAAGPKIDGPVSPISPITPKAPAAAPVAPAPAVKPVAPAAPAAPAVKPVAPAEPAAPSVKPLAPATDGMKRSGIQLSLKKE